MADVNKDPVSARPTTLFSSRLFLIIFFIIIEISIVLFFVRDYTKYDNLHRSETDQHFEASYIGAVTGYDYTTQMIFDEVVNRPEVLKLTALALDDKNRREVYRNELHRLMLPLFEKQKAIGILQFHFHLKDGTSFLRMHAPEVYGDNLFRRTAVRLANKERKPVKGYEVGYFADGYRFIYPLFYNGRHIGNIEFGITSRGIINYVNRISPGHYSFMIDRTVVDNMTYTEWKKLNYSESDLSEDFFTRQGGAEDRVIASLNQKLKYKVRDRLSGMERFVEKEDLNGKDYLIVFLPINDVEGKPAAYIVQYKNDEHSGHQFSLTIINIMVVTLLTTVIFFSVANIQARRRSIEHENIKLEQITTELLKYKLLSMHARDIILIIGSNGQIIEANEAAAKAYGYRREEFTSLNIRDLRGSDTSDLIESQMKQADERGILFETVHRRRDGSTFAAEVSSIGADIGSRRVLLSIIRDITERKEMEKRLEEATITDDLTGLYNRRGFFTFAESHFRLANRRHTPLTLFFIDLDGLKTINDELGHKNGDLALKDTADILRRTFRASDIIARIGGDEFAVLLAEPQHAGSVESVASHIEKSFSTFNKIAGRPYEIMVSVGVAHNDYNAPGSVNELLSRADAQMYEEKKRRKISRGAPDSGAGPLTDGSKA